MKQQLQPFTADELKTEVEKKRRWEKRNVLLLFVGCLILSNPTS